MDFHPGAVRKSRLLVPVVSADKFMADHFFQGNAGMQVQRFPASGQTGIIGGDADIDRAAVEERVQKALITARYAPAAPARVVAVPGNDDAVMIDKVEQRDRDADAVRFF